MRKKQILEFFNDINYAYNNSGMHDSLSIMLDEMEHEIRNKAIDEFAEKIIERLKGMQMAELQGEDVCPYGDTFEECPYINSELGCQYCAREQTIKDIDEIAEQMKGE